MPSTPYQPMLPLLSCLMLAACWKQTALAPNPLAGHPREVRVATASGSQVVSMPRIVNDTLRGVLPGGLTVDSVLIPMATVVKLEVPGSGERYAQGGVLLAFVGILVGVGLTCAARCD